MAIHIPSFIQSLIPYRPGKPIEEIVREYGITQVTKLASNENPLGPSPKAMEAAQLALPDSALYPNGGKTIREVLAKHYGLTIEEVIAGSGSEGVMNNVMRTFLVEGDEVLTSEATFGGFYVLAHAMGLDLKLAPAKEYRYDLDAIAARITAKTRLIYLANPNNPTGSYFTSAKLIDFLDKVPEDVLVIYDEAYYDFAVDDCPDYPSLLTSRRKNVITLRTFSKSHGLAGLRIGFATASPEIIGMMLKVKLPFEPSGVAQAAGIAAIDDTEFLKRTIEVNRKGRTQWKAAFDELGVRYLATAANFYCTIHETPEAAEQITTAMEREGIIVRNLAGFGLPNCVRISIGTQEQNERGILALKEVLESVHVA